MAGTLTRQPARRRVTILSAETAHAQLASRSVLALHYSMYPNMYTKFCPASRSTGRKKVILLASFWKDKLSCRKALRSAIKILNICNCSFVLHIVFFPARLHWFEENLRGAWRDRDTNDIFAHCSLIFYFLDFKFSNFVCPSELHPLIWFFFKNSFRKKKNIRKTTQNALAPSIFIVLSIALKLSTPLLHTQAQNSLLQNVQFRSRNPDMDEKPPKTLFYPTRSALTKHNFFRRSKLKNL